MIILAKANLVIYLSDIIEKHPTHTKRFAKILNDIFHFLTESNLGTLQKIINTEEEKFDLILTNPPYITSGVTSMKSEISDEGLGKYYSISSKGVDGLALQWIIRNLKQGGRAIVIISNGVLESGQNKSLREYLLKECYFNGLISLPIKTFFNTPQKTYILVITKKQDAGDIQLPPVFTYLVSNIGETLDINRFEIEGKSDLERAKELFNLYKGAPESFPIKQIGDLRCKLQPIRKFAQSSNWNIDRWWTSTEKIKLGVEQPKVTLDIDDYIKKIIEKKMIMEQSLKQLYGLKKATRSSRSTKVAIEKIFDPFKGSAKYTKKYIRNNSGEYPVYSSQTVDEGIIGKITSFDFEGEAITWTTDGVYAGTPFLRNGKFSMTTHCGALFLKKELKDKIDLGYIFHYLKQNLRKHAVGEGNKRLTVELISPVIIDIPINGEGDFDIEKQREIAHRSDEIQEIRTQIELSMRELQIVDLEI